MENVSCTLYKEDAQFWTISLHNMIRLSDNVEAAGRLRPHQLRPNVRLPQFTYILAKQRKTKKKLENLGEEKYNFGTLFCTFQLNFTLCGKNS